MGAAENNVGLPAMPSFASFYRAINGWDPFPWQARLAGDVVANGSWPREIGVPTGLGKTACLDIAIWWLASEAHLEPDQRTAPTRIWWVVNRRLLVDSTFEHAERIGEALRQALQDGAAADEAVSAVAVRLKAIAARDSEHPLEVVRLRGGFARGRPSDPGQPAVILSTVPMYGSRLLFRGYGSTTTMRPIDAALAGTDSLVLLDEAHLARHLPRLVDALAECAPARTPVLPNHRSTPRLVALTATGEATESDRFDIGAEDEAHPEVSRRLEAPKPMEVLDPARKAGPALFAATAALMKAAPAPAAFIVFANQPSTAREVFGRLRKDRRLKASVQLLTGRNREHEAELIRASVLDSVTGMPASRDSASGRDVHLVVVATQTLEVGADLDAEYLVTEACGVRALTQRLGRLNRLGRFPHARAVYVDTLPSKKGRAGQPATWPVYGEEPATVRARLAENCSDEGGTVDVAPRNVSAVLGKPCDDPGRAPEVLHGILWEWMKTTTPPVGEAPVEPYFSGISDRDYTVSLVWRAHLPDDGRRLWPRARAAEAVDVPIGELGDLLAEDEQLHRLLPDGVTVKECEAGDLRPGDQLVLPADRGLLDEFGWAPSSVAPVHDVSIRENGLPLDQVALNRLCGVTAADRLRTILGDGEGDEEAAADQRRDAVRALLDSLAGSRPVGWVAADWCAFLDGLGREPEHGAGNEVSRLVPVSPAGRDRLPAEDDQLSFADEAVLLDRHCEAVGAGVADVGRRLGMPHELEETLGLAGDLHDAGKADLRFQRWLDPSGEPGSPLKAKSAYPRSLWDRFRAGSGWPRGGRHEALSARLVGAWLSGERGAEAVSLPELLLHLVISHHGSGRPLVPPIEDSTSAKVRTEFLGKPISVPAQLSEVDWNQPSRFRTLNDQYGPWGLALLEAVLRQADHKVSSARSRGGGGV